MKCSKKIYGIILLFLMFVMIFAVGCGTATTEESEESLESESSEIPDNDSYDTATTDSYTYDIVYVSSNGTSLGTSTVSGTYGETKSVSPDKSFSGYTTPSAQSVVWDSTTAKTITFIYTPSSVTNSAYSGTRSTSPNVTYLAEFEYQNRTATSVQIRATWTLTIADGYDSYAQLVQLTVGENTSSAATVVSFGTWADLASDSRTASATTDWVTVPLSTTNQTTVSASVYSYNTNAVGDEMGSGATYSFDVNIPAY
ncbi:MAG: hypothetical protein LUH03_04505 [Oscillospiraceae bacterium]|nr:hypothetical protein [Oscillospiraceae bacterium]